MKFETFQRESIIYPDGRTKDELRREIKDRLDYMFLNIDGSYSLPSDLPMLTDTLKMMLRLGDKA